MNPTDLKKPIHVMKFGGTSVATPSLIQNAAQRIAAAVAEQVGLTRALRGAAKQRSLMAMEPLLPGPKLIGIQHQLRGW